MVNLWVQELRIFVNQGQFQPQEVILLHSASCHNIYPILDPRATLLASCPVFRALSHCMSRMSNWKERKCGFLFDVSLGRNRIVIAKIRAA